MRGYPSTAVYLNLKLSGLLADSPTKSLRWAHSCPGAYRSKAPPVEIAYGC